MANEHRPSVSVEARGSLFDGAREKAPDAEARDHDHAEARGAKQSAGTGY
jgi:hypothetical protein